MCRTLVPIENSLGFIWNIAYRLAGEGAFTHTQSSFDRILSDTELCTRLILIFEVGNQNTMNQPLVAW